MKILREKSAFTKLCHARPGDVVVLVDSMCETDEKAYLVCALEDGSRCARPDVPEGLYDDKRRLFLVDLSDGTCKAHWMPHLSSRVIIYRKAEIHLGKADAPSA